MYLLLLYLFFYLEKVGENMFKELLKDDGEYIRFNGEYLEMYIPVYYFESKLAENSGTSIRVFGLFNLRVFVNNKPMKLETLNIPSMIYIYPSEIEKRNIQLIKGEDGTEEQYIVAKFYKDNKIMVNSISQDASNVELFLNLIFNNKLPSSISYHDVLNVWLKNLQLNNIKLGVPSAPLEIIIREIYRNKNKLEETFSKVIGKNPNISPFSYKTANIREICARNSTFAALTFEDMDSMITSSLNIQKYKKEETISPIEKIIKM